MLLKNYKFLIAKKENFISLSVKNVTSYFSKMNLKEKHSADFKTLLKQKKEMTQNKEKNIEQINSNNQIVSQKSKIWSSPIEALQDMKKQQIRSENEIIQLNIGLNVDMRRGDQNVRGIFKMPGGSTKTPKVIAFVQPEFVDIAKNAGADLIGDMETIKEIQNGQIDFEKCVATIEMLPMLKTVGRILGPMGLMPNAKIGTACTHEKLESIIKDLKLGSKEFRVDVRGQIIVPVGKRNFPVENILENIHSFMTVLSEKKPETIKGRYFLYSFISARRLSYKIDMKTLDPKTSAYFKNVITKKSENASKLDTKKLNPAKTENLKVKVEEEVKIKKVKKEKKPNDEGKIYKKVATDYKESQEDETINKKAKI